MKKAVSCLAAITFFLCGGITISCSQTSDPTAGSFFEATTPCNEAAKKMLGIPLDLKCEMMRWAITLYKDPNKDAPTTFSLNCTYGLAKQGTRGFMEGATTIELKGKCSTGKSIRGNTNAIIYKLAAENSTIVLSFLKADENLLHLLSEDKHLVIGGAGWSYTFNRTNPVVRSQDKFIPVKVSPQNIHASSDTVGIFQGRTPCNAPLRAINNIPPAGCQVVKCQLILLQDIKTHSPSTFILKTIYVGNGDDNIYSVTGKWKLMQGALSDPASIIYQLETGPGKSNASLLLLKADDNILFFLDKDTHYLVGDQYSSYTLNRKLK
jgi:hypothetical protein